jgi:uncharacterized protein involved in type VI secretion and phage assembly
VTSGIEVPGVTPAIVVANDDPQGMFRVKLRLPWMGDDFQTDWARIVLPYGAAPAYPEIGDEVLVAFERGDVRYPYVLGRLTTRS